ncbi:MAG: replicative DNA helicase [Zetaproteobacteria bacterium]|nr:replicative DNA helicase [Zetaproteobacteria bacterium]
MSTVNQQVVQALPLPFSEEAERNVLGAILSRQGNEIVDMVGRAALSPEQFYLNQHSEIYKIILELEAEGRYFDNFEVVGLIQKRGHAWYNLVYDLVAWAPLALSIEHYAGIVRKNYYLRRIIDACQDTAQKARLVEGELSDFIGNVEKEFLAIAQEQEQADGLVSASVALKSAVDAIEKRIAHAGEITGVPSGFNDLDKFTGGWQNSDLVILAARPGMGKTALALNWAINALECGDSDACVAVFTLEMSKEQLVERLISSKGRIDSVKMRKGLLDEDEQDRLMHGARAIHGLGSRLVIDETPGITLLEVRSRCRRYKKEKGRIDLVIIDYLQLMQGSVMAQKQSREREISEISMGLKALAKELSVPIIALAQLNRGPDARPDKKPRISDLRESGSMEQDADQIMFVYRDEYYNVNSEHAGKAEVIIAKNRHGETGSAFLAWQPNYVSFFNLIENESMP